MSDFDRVKKHLAAVVEILVGKRLDYSALYPAKVVRQSGNLLEVIPEDDRIKGNGMASVPIRHGLPGVTVEVSQGARVRIGFENQDPKKPFAALFDTDAAFVTVCIGSNAEFVALANLVKSELDNIQTKYDLHTHLSAAPTMPTSPPTPLIASVGSVAATKVKAE